jgi:hypothetical protein
MGDWIFYTAVVVVVGAGSLYAWMRRNDPPAALTPRRRKTLEAMRRRGRTAFILRTGVLGFGLTLAVVKTILAYAGFNDWRQPELEPLARFGYWFVRMLPIHLPFGAIFGFYLWREQSKQFHLLDDPAPSIGPATAHRSA